jgi:bifunctional UDP-N-acetylglucosamine pyrophosphorylase / glucosamine-1-phosphate N-acetyltransferase
VGELQVIVLAAGEGTRMKSSRPKVVHGFAGRSMLQHVLAAATVLGADQTCVVIGHGRDEVAALLAETPVRTVVQERQLGTGHAVRVALAALPERSDATIVVLPGDAPLLQSSTLLRLYQVHRDSGAAATLLTSVLSDPTGYGRVVRSGDAVVKIVEHRDATPEELAINEIGTSVYAFAAGPLRTALDGLKSHNAQGEEYLTDVIEAFVGEGRAVGAVFAPVDETAGVNDRVQLAAAQRTYNVRLLEEHMRNGVTITDPATTWLDAEVRLAPDVTLLPNTDLRGHTSVAAGATIGPHTTLDRTTVGEGSVVERAVCRQAVIGADVTIGPFAYLRPGTQLADRVHIGTFVELKASDVGVASKIPHLSYVGDATIGEHTNIGAATVFVNYDGVAKHHSTVGSHARTGAGNMLVGPVSVSDGAYTAAGSVIDEDVPPGALGIARARQTNVPNWVARRRPGTPADAAAQRAPDESSGGSA